MKSNLDCKFSAQYDNSRIGIKLPNITEIQKPNKGRFLHLSLNEGLLHYNSIFRTHTHARARARGRTHVFYLKCVIQSTRRLSDSDSVAVGLYIQIEARNKN